MKPLDFVIIALTFGLGITGLFFSLQGDKGAYVTISTPYGDYRYTLESNQTITVEGLIDEEYTFEIKDGAVRVIKSSCPDGLCEKRGWVFRENDSIVCVPNQIIARIENENEREIDAITE